MRACAEVVAGGRQAEFAASTPISPHVPSGTAFRIPGFNLTANSATVPPLTPGRSRGPAASPAAISTASCAFTTSIAATGTTGTSSVVSPSAVDQIGYEESSGVQAATLSQLRLLARFSAGVSQPSAW